MVFTGDASGLYGSILSEAPRGAVSDIECGQNTVGIALKGQIVTIHLINDHEQDIIFVDTNSTFVPVLSIKDSAGRYIESAFAADCDEMKCDGKVFTMKGLSRGQYIIEMTPDGDGGAYKVDVICSSDDHNVHDASEMAEFEGIIPFSFFSHGISNG